MKEKVAGKRLYRLFAVPCFILALGIGGPVREKTEEGNRQYDQANYDRALTSYVEARSHAEQDPESTSRLHLNIGDALYQQKKYEEARKEFEQSLLSEDDALREKSHYNIGNTWFQEAMQAKDIELLKKAAASYRSALEIDPDDEDAKYNLEVVRRHIDLQQPPPSQSCPKDEKKEEQEQQQDEQQSQQGQDQQQQEEQREENQQEQQQQEQARQEQEQQGQMQQAGQEDRKFTEEEAKRILDALKEREKEELKESQQAPLQGRPMRDKDW